MTRKQKRMAFIAAGMAALAGAVAMVLVALNQNITFFRSPSDLIERPIKAGQHFRLGGLVVEGSVKRDGDGVTILFVVTDTENDVPVRFRGILPDLFREGQGVVTEGALDTKGVFVASEVLAKHDETYMPKEVADALKKKGVWQGKQ